MPAELNIGAAATFQSKQRWGKPNSKNVSFGSSNMKRPWRGNITQCKHCHNYYGENEVCESNPNTKGLHQNTLTMCFGMPNNYVPKCKCWCCHASGRNSVSATM